MFSFGNARKGLSSRRRRSAAWAPQPLSPSVPPRSASAAEGEGDVTLDEGNFVAQAAPILSTLVGDMTSALLGQMPGRGSITGRPRAALLTSPYPLVASPTVQITSARPLPSTWPDDAPHPLILGGWEHGEARAQRPRDQRRSAEEVVERGALLLGGLWVQLDGLTRQLVRLCVPANVPPCVHVQRIGFGPVGFHPADDGPSAGVVGPGEPIYDDSCIGLAGGQRSAGWRRGRADDIRTVRAYVGRPDDGSPAEREADIFP